LNRKKLRYIITPEGIALRAKLTVEFIQNQFHLFRVVRQRSINAIEIARDAGFSEVNVVGCGDVADVCKLTCLEQGLQVAQKPGIPRLIIKDLKVNIEMDQAVNK